MQFDVIIETHMWNKWFRVHDILKVIKKSDMVVNSIQSIEALIKIGHSIDVCRVVTL